ncbi:MAG TPA: YkgJ family cysteine cluster protein [Candidatus Hydrogenedentes bacterium]|nr:YkgJ family cysteine cluster protein [Candidatus Hydrogenedentota bacterium]HQE82386.1 YkgJ family cysteine cluster protein [Candidatus Hydrogenedentota bacterium]HQM49561.1 YkgJ family cysteine cluster protein [Candidatus Hydrogenedentota bacterium]
MPNPCLTCGACCAYFRVSFHWAECDDETSCGVPVGMTEDLGPFRRMMKGTGRIPPRCVALEGEVCVSVYCSIYARRPSICRAVKASYATGQPSEQCDKARLAYGLPPLTPGAWHEPDGEPVPTSPEPDRRRPPRAA